MVGGIQRRLVPVWCASHLEHDLRHALGMHKSMILELSESGTRRAVRTSVGKRGCSDTMETYQDAFDITSNGLWRRVLI